MNASVQQNRYMSDNSFEGDAENDIQIYLEYMNMQNDLVISTNSAGRHVMEVST